MATALIINENFAAVSFRTFEATAPKMVAPERETPGSSANPCMMPMASALGIRMLRAGSAERLARISVSRSRRAVNRKEGPRNQPVSNMSRSKMT